MLARPRATVAALAALAVAIRIPAFVADRHLTFDDGVFGASAVAMRHGGAPFREVFSSQGPVFLPLVWMGDLAGLRTHNAPRLLALVSGVAATLLVFAIGRRLAGPAVGLLAALVTTVSGSVLWTTGPLAADGPGLALALGAFALILSHRDAPSTTKAVATGVFVGAAFAVKSLFAIPVGLAIAWVFVTGRDWRRLGLAVTASSAVVLAAALPWGLADVWDQAVDYHLDAAGDRTPGRNAGKTLSTLWDRDLIALGFAVTGGLAFAADRVRQRQREGGGGGRDRAVPAVIVLGATVLVLLLEHPLWRPHLAHLVPAMALVSAYAVRRHLVAAGVVLALLAVPHAVTNRDVLWPSAYEGQSRRAAAALSALPAGAFVISDEPGFPWRAGLRTPDDLVDASILRMDSRRITAASLTAAASDPRVCAVLVWSHRFARFDLGPRLDPLGYEVAARYGSDRVLYHRPCAVSLGGGPARRVPGGVAPGR